MSYEAWGDGDEHPECPHCEENSGIADELAVFIKRLVRMLRKVSPDSDLAKSAMDYLEKNDLLGEPLRDIEMPTPPAPGTEGE